MDRSANPRPGPNLHSRRVWAWWLSGLLITPVIRSVIAFHAVPAGRPWRRSCDRCHQALRLPWLSAAFLPAGRCPACGQRVGAPPYAVELVAVAAIAVLFLTSLSFAETVAVAWWTLCALALVFVDARVHRLPDRLTVASAAGTVLLLGVAALVQGDGHAWLRSVGAGAGIGLAFLAMTLVLGQRGPGLGDAKFAVSTAAILGWIGWPAVLAGLFLAFLFQGVWAIGLLVARRADRSTQLAFGPFLAAGALGALGLFG